MISIIIPVHNSQLTLGILVDRIISTLSNLSEDFEIILVDDGNIGNTWITISDLALNIPCIKGFLLGKNYGQHQALLCGLNKASGDIVITLDDDLQHPPEYIPELILKLRSGFELVYAAPNNMAHSYLRTTLSWAVKSIIAKVLKAPHFKDISPFRAFNSRLIKEFIDIKGEYINIDVVLSWYTDSIGVIKVPFDIRRHNKSGYKFSTLFNYAKFLIMGYTVIPLKVVTIMGFLFSFIGLLLLFYLIFSYLNYGATVPGFYFISISILVFSGFQLIAFGIIGDYISIIYKKMLSKPLFSIKSTT